MGGEAPVDQCKPNPCTHGTCENDGASYTCTCETGYRGDNCEINIDDCAGSPCTHGTCIDGVAAYQCDCGATGYTGKLCDTLIQNCAQTPCANGGVCTDVGASRTCDCTGTGATGASCEVDIDECAANPCVHGTCTNGKNQYTCNCASTGYKGTNCDVDIDECANHPCDPLTTCTNSAGSFSCSSCPAGYSGTGLAGCTDINECLTSNGGCDPLTTCANTAGSRTCGACPSGYSGTGATGCTDINECLTSNGGCDPLTTCNNTAGSHSCGACPSGYSGTGSTGCTNIDDCAGSPCKNGGTCKDLVNDYKCTCTGAWSGTTCQNATLTIDVSARGFYPDANWFPPSAGNTTTGWSGEFGYASYFIFAIPSFTGTVSSVTLRLEHEYYDSPDTSEIVRANDVSTPIATLLNNTSPDQGIYQDLSTGTQYGNLTGWTAATVGSVRSFALSGALTAVSNARGSNFAVGISVSSLSKGTVPEVVAFSENTETRVHQLQIVVTP
jgi:Notch-like protein